MLTGLIQRLHTMPLARRKGLAAVYTLFLALASLINSSALEEIPLQFDGEDILVHLLLYCGYALLLCWAWPAWATSRRAALAVAAWCTLYGAAMECLQHALQWLGRTFSVMDALANTVGALGGAWIASRLVARLAPGSLSGRKRA